jgi:hypothetical protein
MPLDRRPGRGKLATDRRPSVGCRLVHPRDTQPATFDGVAVAWQVVRPDGGAEGRIDPRPAGVVTGPLRRRPWLCLASR